MKKIISLGNTEKTELDLLRLAREELLELRGYLCDYTGKFNPRMDKLQKYWNEPKPEWERELSKLKTHSKEDK